MLRSYVVVIESARLFNGKLDHFLRAWRKANIANYHPVTAPDNELDGTADLLQLDAKVGQDLRSNALALTDEP